MIRLAVETSTMTQSVAVEVQGLVVSERIVRRRAGHSSSLLATVESALSDVDLTINDVQEIICGLGPGSFTGIRVGLAFALGVSAGLNIPIYGVNSMRAFLSALPSSMPIAVALDARKQEVYGAVFSATSARDEHIKASTFEPQAFFDRIEEEFGSKVLLVGDGPRAFTDAWQTRERKAEWLSALSTPKAAGLLQAHRQGHSQSHRDAPLEPRYIRPSDAEKTRAKS